ncbi:hypothetical protein AALP_AA8G175200 [Arabis alpina]|uniref:TIR domain-containing protein n=1 Tax=Arabis alpina TaxID=50452 RepID=A0A087G7N6_ARAAL|nr:hypothetical protein AALP_AA8G175200 [Arabis alpina]
MDSSFFLTTCAAATSFFALLGTLFFMFYKKFRIREKNETENPTSLSLLPPPFSLPRNWTHNVFPSFHGADVRKSFLSHFLKECRSKGIDPFIDNEITRGEFIGPELQKAIKGSRIAVVLLSKKYASSSWCLDELVEIMKCNEDEGYTVMVIFYEVDPTDVKKQAGEFGKVFKETCKGKTNEVTGRWSQALAKVATIAGYHSSNSENEAKMVEEIVTAISNKLFSSTRSRDLDDFVGIEAHMEKMEQFLDIRPGSDEVRMIGIWGPPGIGKTTIARCVFNQHSSSFDLSVFMSNVKAMYTPPVCSDDSDAKLNLQQKFLSQITNQKEGFKITHLGAVQERLHDKRVLVILDNVDQSVQLEALAKETGWFGHGSRIIITTQDQNLLRAHGINHVYKVGVPPMESVEIFCMYAFKQKTPAPGFQHLAWDATFHAGQLPLGLKVIGSSFRGKSKQQWEDALRTKFSCLLVQLGKEIVRKKYGSELDIRNPWERRFLVDATDIYEVLSDDTTDSRNVIGLDLTLSKPDDALYITSERAFERMTNLQFLRIRGRLYLPQKLNSISRKLILLDWDEFPMICLPSNFNSTFLVDLRMQRSKLEKLWDDTQLLPNLKWMDLGYSVNLKELPDLSTATNLELLLLNECSNLLELPSSIGNAINLKRLLLEGCTSLVELPSSIGNATNLETLELSECSSLLSRPQRNCHRTSASVNQLVVSNHKHAVIPGGEVPDYFSYRANGGTVTVKLNERPPQEPVYYSLHANGRTITVKFDEPPYKSLFKACFALVKVGDEAGNAEDDLNMSYTITDIQHDLAVPYAWRYLRLPPLPEHLYTIAIEAAVTSSNWLSFELSIGGSMWAIKECGILQLS